MRADGPSAEVQPGRRSSARPAFVVIATRGRPADVTRLLAALARQTLVPEAVVVVGTCAADLPGPTASTFPVIALTAPQPGSALQRNIGLDRLAALGRLEDERSFVAFFDDDFRPAHDWLEQAAAAFAETAELVGVTGQVLADGVNGSPIGEAEASEYISGKREARAHWSRTSRLREVESLYGCNMAVTAGVARSCRFDDKLPLYSWQEDCDYTGQARRLGKTAIVPDCRGVHLGARSGRVPGIKLGYSQIANPLRIAIRGNMPWLRASRFMAKALVANTIRSRRKAPHVDYKGRLKGNLIAISDLARLRCDPARILTL